MKKHALLSILFFGPLFAQALPYPKIEVGQYKYQGHHQVDVQIKQKIVPVVGEKNQYEVERLRREGYTCVLKTSDFIQCSLSLILPEVSREVASQVNQKFDGYVARLSPAMGDPKLEVNAESYQQWQVSQEIFISSKELSKPLKSKEAKYVWANGVRKIYPVYEGKFGEIMFAPVEKSLGAKWILRTQKDRFSQDFFYITAFLD